MFVKKDTRKIKEILEEGKEDGSLTSLFLARRGPEFVSGSVRQTLCRPHQLACLSSLEHLSLYQNDLVSIGGLGSLGSSLVTLDLGRNHLTEIPAEISKLESLEEICCEDNALSSMKVLTEMRNLRVIRLSGNQLKEIPSTVGALVKLQKLMLDNNKLDFIPDEVGALKELQVLNLRGNKIRRIPLSFVGLESLVELILSSNLLEVFDVDLSRATALKKLRLNGNKITTFPTQIISLVANETQVNLANNCIADIPQALPDNFVTFGQNPASSSSPSSHSIS